MQRYRPCTISNGYKIGDIITKDDSGDFVLYADHLAEIAANERTIAILESANKDLRAERDELKGKYNELIMEVGSKYPGETRHETAKRYIRSKEKDDMWGIATTPKIATTPNGGGDEVRNGKILR